MHQVGGRLQQRYSLALFLAEGYNVGVHLDGPVGEIGCKIVERLRTTGWSGESNPNNRRGPLPRRKKAARLIKSNSLYRINRAAGPRKKHIQERQSPTELHLPKIDLHVLS